MVVTAPLMKLYYTENWSWARRGGNEYVAGNMKNFEGRLSSGTQYQIPKAPENMVL